MNGKYSWLGVLVVCLTTVAATSWSSLQVDRIAAERGDADAQYNLGMMYADGRGVPQDDTTAVEWFQKAAEQGHALAQKNLGVVYEQGRAAR